MLFQDVPKPTGEVSGVCWTLLGAVVAGAGIALKWFDNLRKEKDAELKAERELRDKDRKDFEAQTNVFMSNILKKKGGSTSDS